MIQNVVHGQPSTKLDPVTVKLEVHGILQPCVKRQERWGASRVILRTEAIPVLIES